MGRKKVPGLVMRGGSWHIDKYLFGRRICQSTGTARLEEAEQMLARVMEEARQAQIYGVRPARTFEQAAAKYVLEHEHKRSPAGRHQPAQGALALDRQRPRDKLHMGTLQPWIAERQRSGVSVGTINHGLQIARRILNLAAGEWMDEQGLTWLHAAPRIKLLPNLDKRRPYPLSWEEQSRLFGELPEHLAGMALFAVNTGCRDLQPPMGLGGHGPRAQDVGLHNPGPQGEERRRPPRCPQPDRAAGRRRQAWEDAQYVFAFKGKPVRRMLNSARARAGLDVLRVHDLKHTFGRRLRASGVSFEDRQDLLEHRSGRITTHYSAADLSRLIEAANNVVERDGRRPELVVLGGALRSGSRKIQARDREGVVGGS
jgi:integrase